MIIYGAGMAGLLAANMLRRYQPTVCEAAEELPDNHGALLRFRSRAVADATGQHFKRVWVNKAVKHNGKLLTEANLKISNLYSQKVTGEVMGRSVMNLSPAERYIAPDDFIATMAKGSDVKLRKPLYGAALDAMSMSMEGKAPVIPVISTIPMPVLMDLVDWPKPEFKFLPIWSFRARIERPYTDVYQTIYYPDPDTSYYRASITGDQLIVEYAEEVDDAEWGIRDVENWIAEDFGLMGLDISNPEVKYQHYGKLLPMDERERRRFILAMTDEYGIYSVVRFATWRQLLMDDIVEDVQVVEQFIRERDGYSRAMHYAG